MKKRWLFTIALVAVSIAVGGGIAYAWLTSTVSTGSASITTGKASLSVDTSITAPFEFTNLIPTAGGPSSPYSAVKQFSLTNSGDVPMSIALSAATSGWSANTPGDIASKLDVQIDESVSGVWLGIYSGNLGALATPQSFNSNFVAPTPGGPAQTFRISMWLDESANDSYQSLAGSVSLTFTGTQSSQ